MYVVSVSFAALFGNSVPGTHFLLFWEKTYMIYAQFLAFFQLYVKYMGNFLADISYFPE